MVSHFDFFWKGVNFIRLHSSWISLVAFPGGSDGKEFACSAGDPRVQSLGWEDSLEKVMAIHSSVVAWRIPWTEEPGRLQSLGLQRVKT